MKYLITAFLVGIGALGYVTASSSAEFSVGDCIIPNDEISKPDLVGKITYKDNYNYQISFRLLSADVNVEVVALLPIKGVDKAYVEFACR